DGIFDCITIGFGLRNVTDKRAALGSMRRALKPGGQLLVLEFSHPSVPGLKRLYDAYSFRILPLLGRWVAGDEASYRYLAESIRDIARLRVASNGLQLTVTRDQEPADATVSGGPLGVLALAADSPEPVLARGGVAITGDAELAQKFRELARLLKPDLEEELSLLVGDVPAHQLGRLARLP